MLSLPLTIACLAAVLPIHLTSCGDPLIWGSVEAQAEYKDKRGGAPGGDCFNVPNTFEMRVDGSCLATSEFGLIGNLDKDCDIHILLSTPEGDATDDELEKIVELRDEIYDNKKDLQVKEDALEKEKKAHEEKMVELKKEMDTVKETEDNLNKLKAEKIDLGERKEDNERRGNLLREKKEKLDKDLDTAIKENENTWVEILKKITAINADVVVLDKLSDAKCSKIPPIDHEIIADKINVSKGSDNYICHTKELNTLDVIEEVWKSEIEKFEKRMKDLMDEKGTWQLKVIELTNEIKEHDDQVKALKEEENVIKTMEEKLKENKSEMEKQINRENDIDRKRNTLKDRMIALGDYSRVEFVEKEANRVTREKSDVEKEIRRLERLKSADCKLLHDVEYFILFAEEGENPFRNGNKDIFHCIPKK